MDTTGLRFHRHYADMFPEALLALYENQHRPPSVNTMIAYVLVTNRNLQGSWYFSAGDIGCSRTG